MKLTNKRLILISIVLLTILSLWIISRFSQMLYFIYHQGADVPIAIYMIGISFLIIDIFLFILLVKRIIHKKNN